MTDSIVELCDRLIERHGGPGSAHPSPWQLTPLMAFYLVVTAKARADAITEQRAPVLDEALPPLVRLGATPEFHQRFRQCYLDLADRITHAQPPASGWPHLAQCVGEEVALADVLAVAEDDHLSGFFDDLYSDELERLTTNPARDADFGLYETELFKDHDFKVLWAPELDGIEDDETIVSWLGYTNLQPSRWFLPFNKFD